VHNQAELLSLALTVAGLIWAIEVIRFWGPKAKEAYYAKHRTPAQWLVLGIIVSFVGSIIDNLYWGAAWGTNYLGLSMSAPLFQNGVYSNIPFIQVPLVLASVLHVWGAVVHTADPKQKKKEFNRFRNMVLVSGAGFVLTYPLFIYLKTVLN